MPEPQRTSSSSTKKDIPADGPVPCDASRAGGSPGTAEHPDVSYTTHGSIDVVALALLAISIFFWGTAFRAHAVGPEYTSALMFAALRAATGGAVLLIVAGLVRSSLPSRRAAVGAAVSGLLMVTLVLVGATEGTVRAGAANAAVLANTTPFFVLVLGRLFLQERVHWIGILGLLVGFAGVLVMISSQLGRSADAMDLLIGMGFALTAAFGWGAGTLIVKWLVEREPSLDLVGFTAMQYVVGAMVLIILALGVKGNRGTDWASVPLWAAVSWVALGSSAIATIAYFAALKRMLATRAASWLLLVPVVAVLVEVARGAAPQAIVLLGMFLAISGVGIVTYFHQGESQ